MKILKRIACGALAAVLLVPLPARAQTFTDVQPGVWYYECVEKAAQNGWLQGVGSGLYNPENSMSYAELIKMLTSVFYQPDVDLCEVPKGCVWWLPYMETAQEMGLLKKTWFYEVLQKDRRENPDGGYDWTEAGAEHGISRYELAQILLNLARRKELAVNTSTADIRTRVSDWYSIPTRYRAAVSACYHMELLKGNEQGAFSGDDVVSRAQGATILCRFYALTETDPTTEGASA